MDVDLDGTRLWYDVEGPGRDRPTLVLVHGGPGSYDHQYFKPDFGRLASAAQVVYLDLRGHGQSDWGNPADWTVEACADDIRAFCDALGIARPVVYGHSMGAPIVLLYGARHPGHAAGLIAHGAFARLDIPRLVEGFRRVAGDDVAAIAERSYGGEDVPDDEWVRVYTAFGPQRPGDEAESWPHNVQLNKHGMDVLRRLDIVAELAAVDAPTLVIVGELDPVTPIGAAEEVVAALPDGIGQLRVLEDSGHFSWKDVPEPFFGVVSDFVQSTVGRERVA